MGFPVQCVLRVIGLVPTVLSLACAADGEVAVSKTVKLSVAPVPAPAAVFTPSVLATANKGGFWTQMVTKSGIVLAQQRVVFAKGQTETVFSLGGTSFNFQFSQENQAFALKPEKGAAVPLKQAQEGLAPQVLPIANKRKLPVAFPFATVGRAESFFVVRAATVVKGTLDGEQINFLDDNLDGVIDQQDAFSTGVSACYAPMPKRIVTKKGIWTVDEVAADGSKAVFTPDAAATVACSFKFSGESAGHAVIASADGSLIAVVTGANEAMKLPPGDYKLQYGAVYGANGKVMAAMIPGELPAFTVASAGADAKDAKKKQVFAYGGPFVLKFTARVEAGKLVVDPTVTLHGANGERYLDYRWQGPPTVYVNGKQNGSMGFG
jgi:hypothetical protein